MCPECLRDLLALETLAHGMIRSRVDTRWGAPVLTSMTLQGVYSNPGVLGNNSTFNNMSATDLENLIRASNLDGMQANGANPLQVATP